MEANAEKKVVVAANPMARYAPQGKVLTDFMNGTIKGLYFVITGIGPAAFMSWSILLILQTTGLMEVLNTIFRPVMALIGQPPEAAVALISGWLNTPGGLAVCASLVADGTMSAAQLAVMIPVMWSCGSCLQMVGRILTVMKTPKKMFAPILVISWICAFAVGIIGNIVNGIFF